MAAHISIPELGLTIELGVVDYQITEAPEGRTSVTITGYARKRVTKGATAAMLDGGRRGEGRSLCTHEPTCASASQTASDPRTPAPA